MGGKGEEREGAGEEGKGRKGEGENREVGGREGERGRFDSSLTFLYPPQPLHTITNRENFHFEVSNRLSTTSAGFY